MAHFFAQVLGARGRAVSRLGDKSSGVETVAASWNGAIKVTLFQKDGRDWYRVEQTPWLGVGRSRAIAEAPFVERDFPITLIGDENHAEAQKTAVERLTKGAKR